MIFQDPLFPPLALPTQGIEVWQVYLPALAPQLESVVACLSPAEQGRMARFVFERDRQRFGLSRGLLRHLLGTYLQTDPAQLSFAYGPKGKPSLVPTDGPIPALQFNLSHSQDWAVYGISRDRPLGIDVEVIRPLDQFERLAQRCLTPTELATLKAQPQPQPQFFDYWTCKEAFLKAIGEGLSFPMTQVEIQLAGPAVQVLSPHHPGPWMLYPWTPAPDYRAAIVAAGDSVPITLRHLGHG